MLGQPPNLDQLNQRRNTSLTTAQTIRPRSWFVCEVLFYQLVRGVIWPYFPRDRGFLTLRGSKTLSEGDFSVKRPADSRDGVPQAQGVR